MQLTGIHHVTAVTAQVARNVGFYTETLGLRLVKKSVNQDDVSAYHLFYADRVGTPGTDITFFDWPRMGPNVRGTDSIVGTAFRVSSADGLQFWAARLDDLGVDRGGITLFRGRELLPFEDPEGQRLYLINDRGAEFRGEVWAPPGIPADHALRGFYSIVLSMPAANELAGILEEVLNFTELDQAVWIDGSTDATVFSTRSNGGPGSEVWLLEQPQAGPSRLGAGGTHHVAFRVPDVETLRQWRARLTASGLYATDVIDRFWFRSVYFRVSDGILFEIATDGPGFAIDEELDALGEKLVLPPFLEPRRKQIEAQLTPIGA